jgi:predicted regulator of Ras-like GTPase activity (Roadblock/LC7/MglB family)
MLTSLFGDLGPARDPARKTRQEPEGPDQGFAATAILESMATEVNDQGKMVDRHQHDLVVSGSPAQAIRDHFATTRADLETASRLITLLDPVGIWASAVIKALSDAGGRPIERLHLREQTTLRTLATIERTTLVRRHEETLKIYHADVRAPGRENAEIPIALMERSHMTTVVVGPMQPHAIDALLSSLLEAVSLPTWRCPNLLFMLPPSAVWIANKISAVSWPTRLHVHVLNEPMTSASSVWNAMLGMWNHVKTQPAWEPPNAALGVADYPIKVADLQSSEPVPLSTAPSVTPSVMSGPRPSHGLPPGLRTVQQPPAMRVSSHHALDPTKAHNALNDMLSIDGLLGCAVVDGTTGLVLARESREDQPADLDLSAAASAQVLRAHRMAARNMGLSDQIDEVMVSAGNRQQVLRTVSRHPDLFLLALLDKQRANLALARYKLMEVEKGLI